jgi:hypothetical protein
MKETAKSIRIFIGSAITTCVICLFLVPPKSILFFSLFLLSIILFIFWIIMLGVKYH